MRKPREDWLHTVFLAMASNFALSHCCHSVVFNHSRQLRKKLFAIPAELHMANRERSEPAAGN